jgi:predicted site-specific integrase-resolvase
MELEYIKVSDYAKLKGNHYRTIMRHYKKGLIEGYTNEYGRTYLKNPNYKPVEDKSLSTRAVLYARVSNATNKASLDSQIERLRNYAAAKGYEIVDEYKEIDSGLNDNRKYFSQILNRNDYGILLAENKDRITRFGYHYIENLLNRLNIKLEVINNMENEDKDMLDDFISVIKSFCDKIYGSKSKAKTEKIIKELNEE